VTYIIDGRKIAAELDQITKAAVEEIVEKYGRAPGLAVVMAGDDPGSDVYVRSKIKRTREAGMVSREYRLSADCSEQEILDLVRTLNVDATIDGILVQLPLPGQINSARVLEVLDAEKDVDGLTVESAGRLMQGVEGLHPCTPEGCIILARHVHDSLEGLNVVVVGRSILVGKPAAQLFLENNCTVTIAHSRSKNLEDICRSAEILVVAVGRPEMVRGSWLTKGVTVLDVGMNRIPVEAGKTRLVGDVAFEEAKEVAGAITPVPGGVGKMTISCLLRNTVRAACLRESWEIPAVLEMS
jgi:methylenetetrahydrofolate dehydrogenase (NADP+)/methenyltetrahydrofolate cyclohydrolase